MQLPFLKLLFDWSMKYWTYSSFGCLPSSGFFRKGLGGEEKSAYHFKDKAFLLLAFSLSQQKQECQGTLICIYSINMKNGVYSKLVLKEIINLLVLIWAWFWMFYLAIPKC